MGSTKLNFPLLLNVGGGKRLFRFKHLNPPENEVESGGIVSDPPPGCHKVLNLYVDQDGKLKYSFDDSGG